jgi:cation diffusion facilitator family transporter
MLKPERVTWLGLVVNIVLGAVKIGVGVVLHAQALVADGLHSVSDVATDIAVLAGLRLSRRPPDANHHYGHRRVSTLVTVFIGVALLGSAGWIIYEAASTYGTPHPLGHPALAFWVAALSVAPKEALYRVTRAVGLRVGDSSIVANAWHHRTDAFTSIAAAVGLAGVAVGGPDWAFLDHLTAAILAAFLGVTAVRFIIDSMAELTDAAPNAAVVSRIEDVIATTPGVLGFHALRVRGLGGSLSLDVHILVEPDISVVEGHDLATSVERRLVDGDFNVVEAVVHIEPDSSVP